MKKLVIGSVSLLMLIRIGVHFYFNPRLPEDLPKMTIEY